MLALFVSIPLITLEVDPSERQSACKVDFNISLHNFFKGPQKRNNKGEDEHKTQNQNQR
jgi:hypothetical protein